MYYFKRLQKKTIDINIIKELDDKIDKPDFELVYKQLGPIWERVFKKYSVAKKIFQENEIYNLKSLYENYFLNGLSQGSSAGKFDIKFFLKYYFRSINRVKKLEKLSDYQKIKFKYNDFGGNIILKSIFDNSKKYHLEYPDHIYFFLKIKKYLKSYENLNLFFLGDGCGYLSNIFLQGLKNINSVHYIDYYPFLIRQFILNHKYHKKVRNYFYNANDFTKIIQKNNKISGINILINQDSFPEMPTNILREYISAFKLINVKNIFSYNRGDAFQISSDHCNFIKIVSEFYDNYELICKSDLRNNYQIVKFT